MSQYATVDAWMAYFRNQGLPENEAQRRYAEAYAADGVAPPDAGKSAFEENNAYRVIADAFTAYGLGSLAPKILELIQAGYNTEAEIDLMLRETDEYKQRFKANEVRKKAGLGTLSPAEYVALERQYSQVLSANGMPRGFYDSTDDFAAWIGGDVSVQEVQSRVALARRAVYEAPPETRTALREFYGVGDAEIAAWFLDPEKAQPVLDRRLRAAEVASGGAMAGFDVERERAERLADLGVDAQRANEGYQRIGRLMPDAERLSDIYDGAEDRYALGDAEAEVFGDTSSASASRKRRSLASRERAAFSGDSGSAGAASLSARRKGAL
jgi:hypothetical protein